MIRTAAFPGLARFTTALLALAGLCHSPLAQAQAQAQAPGQHPDMNGVWQAIAPVRAALTTTDGKAPPLLPEAQALYNKNRAAIRAGDTKIDGTNRCLPPSLPRILSETAPLQIVQSARKVDFLYEYQRLFQVVPLDVQHPGTLDLNPFLGNAVGRWDSDTLVIDVTAFDDTTLLDASGLPHSDALHVVEHLKLASGGTRLTIGLEIDDPKTFAHPWTATRIFQRKPGQEIKEDACLDRRGMLTSGE